MADNVGSKVSYFLVGLGVGALVGVLFAPKSGEEMRGFLSDKADDGRDYAQRKARELRERADELIERSKDVASRRKDSIAKAVDAGREAYHREASKS
jgi:gas vesicle protein